MGLQYALLKPWKFVHDIPESEMCSPERMVHAVFVEGRLAPPRVRKFVEALGLSRDVPTVLILDE